MAAQRIDAGQTPRRKYSVDQTLADADQVAAYDDQLLSDAAQVADPVSPAGSPRSV